MDHFNQNQIYKIFPIPTLHICFTLTSTRNFAAIYHRISVLWWKSAISIYKVAHSGLRWFLFFVNKMSFFRRFILCLSEVSLKIWAKQSKSDQNKTQPNANHFCIPWDILSRVGLKLESGKTFSFFISNAAILHLLAHTFKSMGQCMKYITPVS